MADKLTQQIVDALSRAAADPVGVPLFASKSDPGLFASVPAGKAAAQKCLADGLLQQTPNSSKTGREQYTPTDAGWAFLLAAANPKQVLEDFVRVLEARQGEVDRLLDAARRMADSLTGLREAVARVLPRVVSTRVAVQPPCEPSAAVQPDLTDTILAKLSDWSSSALTAEDCPLPELYRRSAAASVGAFHDVLRRLHDRGAVYLHPWTGPLYALPEPTFALLVGHGVAYYASLRKDSAPRSRESADRLAIASA